MNWLKTNYRGMKIPAAGIIFSAALALTWSLFFCYHLQPIGILEPLIFVTVIVSLTGLVDDIAGTSHPRGFRGHISQLLKGKITTGIFKSFVIFVAVIMTVPFRGIVVIYILDLLLVLLMANFVNLLDLRPGRALKFSLLFSLLLIFDYTLLLLPFYILLIPYLYLELREKVMMGDSGANTLGAILGFMSIYSLPVSIKSVLTLLLLGLNLLSEKYSFTEHIKNNRYLNYLDHLGRENNK